MQLKRRLVSLGFCETPTLSMVSEAQVEGAVAGHERTAVPMKNPIGVDYKMMRTTLLAGLAVNELSSGLLNVASRNANLGAPTARLFEVGRVYSTKGEETLVSMLIAGNANDIGWMTPKPANIVGTRLTRRDRGAVAECAVDFGSSPRMSS